VRSRPDHVRSFGRWRRFRTTYGEAQRAIGGRTCRNGRSRTCAGWRSRATFERYDIQGSEGRGSGDSAALRHNCGTIGCSRAEAGARKLRQDNHATVAELVDAQDLGSCGATRGGSSPSGRMAA
jgi:hypothetical protein